ncbi:MAG: hypothetical protein ABEJ56_05065 [Candidatus Nanohaloarchaea archaeon]
MPENPGEGVSDYERSHDLNSVHPVWEADSQDRENPISYLLDRQEPEKPVILGEYLLEGELGRFDSNVVAGIQLLAE